MAVDLSVARRYAQAFVHSCEGSDDLEPRLKELEWVGETYTRSKDLTRFLGSPEIAEEDKHAVLTRTLGSSVGQAVLGLLNLLIRRDRVDHLPRVAEEARGYAELRQGILRGVATTAHPISAKETQRLADAVGKLLKKQVILDRQVDPKLLGGVRVAVGTILLDGSVAQRLKEITQELKSVKVN